MNIKDAKEQIKNAVVVYLAKDEDGHYMIPPEKQRPIFLMGAPGIGKTAIMEQIASELGVAIVSYTMTHHTRQSALGLPYIVQKTYGGREVSVSEYTMSEIIASVYEVIEESGVSEGILFLDEINCVSETLAPSMLQFLQYKTFGRHHVPEGWIIVTAGNPPEYNDSVREFDIATWDRLKRVDVEPDFGAFKEYGRRIGMHPAILTYLEIKKNHFYSIETTVDGKRFVTTRGWEDLSRMLTVCEKKGIQADAGLMEQYIQSPRIAKDFAVYYQLFRKYQSDYQIDTILAGRPSEKILQRASQAEFDERLSLMGLIMDAISGEMQRVLLDQAVVFGLAQILKKIRQNQSAPAADIQQETASVAEIRQGIVPAADAQRKSVLADGVDQESTPAAGVQRRSALAYGVEREIALQEDSLKRKRKAGTLNVEQRKIGERTIRALEKCREIVLHEPGAKNDFQPLKAYMTEMAEEFQRSTEHAQSTLSNAFEFCEMAFHGEQEILLLVTSLTENDHCARFISQYGCEEYFKYNDELLFYERQKDISRRLAELDLD